MARTALGIRMNEFHQRYDLLADPDDAGCRHCRSARI